MSNKVTDIIDEEIQVLEEDLKDRKKAFLDDLETLKNAIRWIDTDLVEISRLENKIKNLNEF